MHPHQPDVVLQEARPLADIRVLLSVGLRYGLFVAVGILMVCRGGNLSVAGGLILTTYGGFVLLSFAVDTVWPSRIEIDSDGFTQTFLWRTQRDRWVDCSDFRVRRTEDRARRKRVVFTNRRGSGDGRFLSGTYGLQAEELAEIMNSHRAAAVED